MKALIGALRSEWARSTRDMITLYVIASPLILALAARLILPSLEDQRLRVGVEPSLASRLSEPLDRQGGPSAIAGEAELRALVAGGSLDAAFLEGGRVIAAPGAIGRLGRLADGAAAESSGSEAADGSGIALRGQPKDARRPGIRVLVEAFIAMTAAVLASIASGLSIVDERSSGVSRALALSPLSRRRWILHRGAFIALVSTSVVGLSSLILAGGSARWGALALAVAASMPLCVSVALLLGLSAADQLSAIGSIKLILPLILTVAFAAVVVPARYGSWFLVFPNAWMARLFVDAFSPGTATARLALDAAMSAASGSILLMLVDRIMGKRIGLR